VGLSAGSPLRKEKSSLSASPKQRGRNSCRKETEKGWRKDHLNRGNWVISESFISHKRKSRSFSLGAKEFKIHHRKKKKGEREISVRGL